MKKQTTNSLCAFTTVSFIILSSAIYSRAGLFDKINGAVNTANTAAKPKPPSKTNDTKPTDQNSQPANASTAEPKPNIVDTKTVEKNPPPPAESTASKIKAFKTLNFGDAFDTVNQKLVEIVVGGKEYDEPANLDYIGETFWRSMFDSDADYEPYKFDSTTTKQSKKFSSLKNYFKDNVGVVVHSSENSAMLLVCYCLGVNSTTPQLKGGGLAIVKVDYHKSDIEKLVDGFRQNFPNAIKSDKAYNIESTMYPGVFLTFSSTVYEDSSVDRKATLTVPTEIFTFTFQETAKLTKDQSDLWNVLMAKDGKTTQLDEYVQSVKTSLVELAKIMQAHKTLEPITYQGWYNCSDYVSLIWGDPKAIFASKQMLGMQISNYNQAKAAKDLAEKEKLKKESESSTGF